MGDVSCAIARTPSVAGQAADPSSDIAVNCERSASGVTVFAYGGGQFKGPAGLQALAGLTGAAWSAASGG